MRRSIIGATSAAAFLCACHAPAEQARTGAAIEGQSAVEVVSTGDFVDFIETFDVAIDPANPEAPVVVLVRYDQTAREHRLRIARRDDEGWEEADVSALVEPEERTFSSIAAAFDPNGDLRVAYVTADYAYTDTGEPMREDWNAAEARYEYGADLSGALARRHVVRTALLHYADADGWQLAAQDELYWQWTTRSIARMALRYAPDGQAHLFFDRACLNPLEESEGLCADEDVSHVLVHARMGLAHSDAAAGSFEDVACQDDAWCLTEVAHLTGGGAFDEVDFDVAMSPAGPRAVSHSSLDIGIRAPTVHRWLRDQSRWIVSGVVSQPGGMAGPPSIAVEGSTQCIAYRMRDQEAIVLACSDDDGATWRDDIILSRFRGPLAVTVSAGAPTLFAETVDADDRLRLVAGRQGDFLPTPFADPVPDGYAPDATPRDAHGLVVRTDASGGLHFAYLIDVRQGGTAVQLIGYMHRQPAADADE